MIDVLYIQNSEHLSSREVATIETILNQKEIDKASRYRRWQDKQAFLLGKLLLATHLVRYEYETKLLKNLRYTSYNRPFLEGIDIDFNISHSGAYVVCAFSQDQQVGVDIEEMQSIDLQSLFYILSRKERENIEISQDLTASFFRIWSAKEAILKTQGCGLVDDLHNLEIQDETGLFNQKIYHLKSLHIHPAYSSILASSTSIGQMTIAEISLQDCSL